MKKGARVPRAFVLGLIHDVVKEVYAELGATAVVITSGVDGTHKRGSAHYREDALDYRTWVLQEHQRQKALEKISHRLGNDFDVVLHKTHLHVEYDPKGAVNQ